MKPTVTLVALLLVTFSVRSQVIVDQKNITDDSKIKYIQLSTYLDKKTLQPVWLIDYGIKEMKDVNLTPKIQINNEELKAISPAAVLNKLYEAGWEYLGDHTFTESMQMAIHTYTLKRRD